MDEILLTRELLAHGYEHADVSRLTRDGALTRVRRGAYAPADAPDRTAEERHHRLVAATVPQLRTKGVLSHASAAILHGLPVWRSDLDRVHLTRPRSGGGAKRHLVEVHTSPLRDADVVEVGGMAVTSLARTVADLTRTLPFDQAVAAGDRALTMGLPRAELEELLTGHRGWPGVRQARRVAAFLDARSESVGESVSRVRFLEALLPAPVPQFEVFDDNGVLVARCDFGWEEQRTLGEFDGKVKYGRLLKPGQSVEDVLYAEKLREDALRDLGWQVVRWLWADLYRRGVIADRVRRAFIRAVPRAA